MWATSPTKFSSDQRTSSGAHQNVPIETIGLRYSGVIRTRSPSPACQVARRSGGRAGSATNTIGADPRRAEGRPHALAGEAVTSTRPWGGRAALRSAARGAPCGRRRPARRRARGRRRPSGSGRGPGRGRCSSPGSRRPRGGLDGEAAGGLGVRRRVVGGGQLPHGVREVAHGGGQALRHVLVVAHEADHVAGEHARVADRVVDLREAAGVAVEQDARGAPRRRVAAVSRPVLTSSSTERIRSSIARASTSARSAAPGRGPRAQGRSARARGRARRTSPGRRGRGPAPGRAGTGTS